MQVKQETTKTSKQKMLPHNRLWALRKDKIEKAADYRVFMREGMEALSKMSQDNSTFGNINWPTSSFGSSTFFDPRSAAGAVIHDTGLTPIQKALGLKLISDANKSRPSFGFSTQDIVKAGVGAGLGLGAASATGKVMGAFFRLSDGTQKKLNTIGALGGLLKATGVWR